MSCHAAHQLIRLHKHIEVNNRVSNFKKFMAWLFLSIKVVATDLGTGFHYAGCLLELLQDTAGTVGMKPQQGVKSHIGSGNRRQDFQLRSHSENLVRNGVHK